MQNITHNNSYSWWLRMNKTILSFSEETGFKGDIRTLPTGVWICRFRYVLCCFCQWILILRSEIKHKYPLDTLNLSLLDWHGLPNATLYQNRENNLSWTNYRYQFLAIIFRFTVHVLVPLNLHNFLLLQ